MMFHSVAFILGFLPVFLAGFFTIGCFYGPDRALYWLTASSLFFYAWWNPEQLALLVGSIMLNYTIACKLQITNRPRAWLTAGVTLNLMALGWFKYADFILHIVFPNAPALNITLPLAISFFTFQQIMFLVDTGRGVMQMRAKNEVRPGRSGRVFCARHQDKRDVESRLANSPRFGHALTKSGLFEAESRRRQNPDVRDPPDHEGEDWLFQPRHRLAEYHDIHGEQRGRSGRIGAAKYPLPPLLPYAAFVTFFPHLIAGPIVRPADIIPQLSATRLACPRIENIADGLLIFLLGLGKKLVLADMFGGFADTGFDAAAHGTALTFFEAWYATLSYALQIYFDFSGYSDMAIGLARMLNVRFPLNFDSPYQAADIAAFWRRWHITLGGFLREYVYIPMGGNRAGVLRQNGNLLATMLLAGLWHGAAWNFVIWGALHGLFLVVHAQYRRWFRPLPSVLGHALTLFAVILAWVPFRAASIASTLAILGGMAGLNGIALPRMIVSALPPLAVFADPVSVMPSLGDAHTLSFPEVSACLVLGWLIVLAFPNVHRMTDRVRHWTLTGSFALSVQALFFAPHIAPFLYFQF